jgi:hypothetical protein
MSQESHASAGQIDPLDELSATVETGICKILYNVLGSARSFPDGEQANAAIMAGLVVAAGKYIKAASSKGRHIEAAGLFADAIKEYLLAIEEPQGRA